LFFTDTQVTEAEALGVADRKIAARCQILPQYLAYFFFLSDKMHFFLLQFQAAANL